MAGKVIDSKKKGGWKETREEESSVVWEHCTLLVPLVLARASSILALYIRVSYPLTLHVCWGSKTLKAVTIISAKTAENSELAISLIAGKRLVYWPLLTRLSRDVMLITGTEVFGLIDEQQEALMSPQGVTNEATFIQRGIHA